MPIVRAHALQAEVMARQNGYVDDHPAMRLAASDDEQRQCQRARRSAGSARSRGPAGHRKGECRESRSDRRTNRRQSWRLRRGPQSGWLPTRSCRVHAFVVHQELHRILLYGLVNAGNQEMPTAISQKFLSWLISLKCCQVVSVFCRGVGALMMGPSFLLMATEDHPQRHRDQEGGRRSSWR